MDRAINISTKEIVSAFEMFKNGSYQNLKRGEWIMPQDSVDNYSECSQEDLHIHYVAHKEYKNKWGTLVLTSPHFAKYPGSTAKTVAEGEDHKKIKNWLFTKMKEDDLQFIFSKSSKKYKFDNHVKLSELNIDWNNYDVEVRTKGYKTLIADILLQFKSKHPLLGSGIFIEIQLSKQSKKETYDRSFARAMHGYSTAWLFRGDFLFDEDTKDIQLKDNKITLLSFSSELKYSGKTFVDNLKTNVEEQCRYIDNKIKESNSNSDEINIAINETHNNINSKLLTTKNNALLEIGHEKEKLINTIRNLEDNPFEEVVKVYKEDIDNQLKFLSKHINNITEKAIDRVDAAAKYIRKITEEKIKSIDGTYPRAINCKKCGGMMIFKVTAKQGKELYECQKCDHIIWIK